MTIAIADVLTDAQLDDFLGGQLLAGAHLLPKEWADAEKARQYALDRVLEHLKRQTPPIREADISDVTELRSAVRFGAAEWLYTNAMTGGRDAELMAYKARDYAKKFDAELSALQITTSAGERVGTFSIGISRR